MKFTISIFVLCSFSTQVYADAFRDALDRHSEERHHEKKIWEANKRECQATYPMYFKTDHEDYDKHFECLKKVKAAINAFEDKQAQELCQKFNVRCDR